MVGVCGPQYAGKTTVAEILAEEYGFWYVEGMSKFLSLNETTSTDVYETGSTEEAHPSYFVEGSLEVKDRRDPPSVILSQCWRSNVNVVVDGVIPQHPTLPDLLKRPYFLLVYVDAPALTRYRRASGGTEDRSFGRLESFLKIDDLSMHDDSFYTLYRAHTTCDASLSGENTKGANGSYLGAHRAGETLITLRRLARVHVTNHSDSLGTLRSELRGLGLTDAERLRPSWDTYFMSLAKLASERTNCMKRRVGCVIARNRRVIATGYNGTPSGVTNCWSGGCPRCNGAQLMSPQAGVALDLCLCLHAEENAIIEAGRERCQNAVLYCNLFPCVLCAKKIVQAGIRQVVYDKGYSTDAASSKLLEAGNVIVKRHPTDAATL